VSSLYSLCAVGHFDVFSPFGRMTSNSSRACAVIRWVSTPTAVIADHRPRSCFPDRPVPCRRMTLQYFGAPDVVDEDVGGAMVVADAIAERPHLCDVEVVDLDRMPTPPSDVTTSAVSSMVSGRS